MKKCCNCCNVRSYSRQRSCQGGSLLVVVGVRRGRMSFVLISFSVLSLLFGPSVTCRNLQLNKCYHSNHSPNTCIAVFIHVLYFGFSKTVEFADYIFPFFWPYFQYLNLSKPESVKQSITWFTFQSKIW